MGVFQGLFSERMVEFFLIVSTDEKLDEQLELLRKNLIQKIVFRDGETVGKHLSECSKP